VHALAARLNRELILIAESDTNDPRLVTSREAGGYGLAAQWSDDFHHAVHAAITGERQGYYCDFGSMAVLAHAITRVFFHDGRWSEFRGRTHGRQVDIFRVPAHRFLGYLQNHDQIGNRATGDRIAADLPAALVKVGAGLVLTAPYTPMLFMGEEWGSERPWLFFCDPDSPELATATREGRRAEFASHGWAPGDVPDPVADATFEASVLDWSEPENGWHTDVLDWYRALIALRRREPELTDPRRDLVGVRYDSERRWFVMNRGRLAIVANLAAQPQEIDVGLFDEFVIASEARTSMMAISAGTVQLPGESVAILRR
jgi:maltooligosyltrehalose trehalohydrolase